MNDFDRARVLRELEAHPFRPPWWLRGGHAQTVYPRFLRRKPSVPFVLEEVEAPDGDLLRLHWAEPRAAVEPQRLALLLHGLEGWVRSNYVLGLASLLLARGWRVAVLEFRGCGAPIGKARRLYHSGETTDLDFIVSHILGHTAVSSEEKLSLYLSGVSLGGNVLAKWLGECGEEVPDQVVAAAVVSAPFNLEISGPAIDNALGGLYVKRFLRTLIPKAVEKEAQHPGCIDLEKARASVTFEEFDTHVTAALHGFKDAHDYWRKCGCGQFLGAVRRPTLLLSSRDDPFNPTEGLPTAVLEENPLLVAQFTDRGGHVGFVQGWPLATRHWAEEQVVRFFEAV